MLLFFSVFFLRLVFSVGLWPSSTCPEQILPSSSMHRKQLSSNYHWEKYVIHQQSPQVLSTNKVVIEVFSWQRQFFAWKRWNPYLIFEKLGTKLWQLSLLILFCLKIIIAHLVGITQNFSKNLLNSSHCLSPWSLLGVDLFPYGNSEKPALISTSIVENPTCKRIISTSYLFLENISSQLEVIPISCLKVCKRQLLPQSSKNKTRKTNS